MPAPTPSNDPLWAFDTPGWTTQGNTGDTIGANLPSVSQGASLLEPAANSGYISRTLDPDVTTAGGAGTTLTMTSGTVYLFLLQVLDPAFTKSVVVVGANAGTSTHAFVGLYNAFSGAQVAITADQTATVFGTTATKINWTTAAVLGPGYYWGAILTVSSVAPTLKAFTLAPEAQLLLTGTGVTGWTLGTNLRFATGVTGLTGLSTLPASLTGTMTCSATATASFIGIL